MTDHTPHPINYLEYLKTKEWRTKRRAVLERARFRCQVCYSRGPIAVHHRTYARLGHEDIEDLTALCLFCHNLFHVRGRWAEKVPASEDENVSKIMAAMISDARDCTL